MSSLAGQPLPRHLAIIMDGNGRWAQQRHLPRTAGHWEGVKTVDAVVSTCRRLGIPALTLFALSTENLGRPRSELAVLMRILRHYLRREAARLRRQGIRLRTIGNPRLLPAAVRAALASAKAHTRRGTAMVLTLALGYGARAEMARAARRLARQVARGRLAPAEIDAQRFAAALDTAGLPPVDLLIRTGGEQRLSNFLLWQSSAAELYFTPVLWPDFSPAHLLQALQAYAQRRGARPA